MHDKRKTIEELEQRIADLKARMPKHSTPPAMLIELEDLEAALKQAQLDGKAEEQP